MRVIVTPWSRQRKGRRWATFRPGKNWADEINTENVRTFVFLHLLLLFSYRAKLGGRRRGFLDTDDVNYLLRVYYVRDSLNYGVSRSAKKSRVEVQEGEREREQRSEYAKGYLVIYKSRWDIAAFREHGCSFLFPSALLLRRRRRRRVISAMLMKKEGKGREKAAK